MNTIDKIQAAEKRIKELQLLIKEWGKSKEVSSYAALKLVKDINQKLAA